MTFRIGTPHTHNAGYFVNDKALASRQEADVQTCSHCQSIIKMQEWKDQGGWCSKCNKPLCNQPLCMKETALKGCVPFVSKVETQIRSNLRLASLLTQYPELPILRG